MVVVVLRSNVVVVSLLIGIALIGWVVSVDKGLIVVVVV